MSKYIRFERKLEELIAKCNENGVEIEPLLKRAGLSPTGQGATDKKLEFLETIVDVLMWE